MAPRRIAQRRPESGAGEAGRPTLAVAERMVERTPGVTLNWNAEKFEFDHPAANEFLHTPYRDGWSLD